jgi:LysM repeat protein
LAGGIDACQYYTVQSGDTLASIAASLGLTQLDLQSANPGITNLQVNDFVKLPGW